MTLQPELPGPSAGVATAAATPQYAAQAGHHVSAVDLLNHDLTAWPLPERLNARFADSKSPAS